MQYKQGLLDELIYEIMADKACDINNAGQDAQVAFLLKEGWKQSEIDFKVGSA